MGARANGLTEMAQVLNRARDEVVDELRKVVKKGAQNIKTDAKARWSGFAHAPDLPRAVTYDVRVLSSSVKAEIGPDKDRRQGALGNLLEYGSVNNAPHPALAPAADAEEPRFADALEKAGADLLQGDPGVAEPGSDS